MTRQEKLKWLIQHRFGGSQSDFAAAIRKAPSQVGQWTGGHRRLGDGGARTIELALDLTPGWFDLPGTENIVAEPPAPYAVKVKPLPKAPAWEAELMTLARAMQDDARRELIGMAKLLAAQKPRTQAKRSS